MFELTGNMLAEATVLSTRWEIFAAAIACGVIIIGASMGIGWIGSRAVDAIARQPEASGDIRANMIVAAALIEGVALFGVIISLLAVVLQM